VARWSKPGGDTWFFMTADYAFGYALEKDTGDLVKEKGGKVLGSVRIPLNSSDFPPSCCRPRARRRRSSDWPTPGSTPPIRSSRRAEFGIVKGGQKLAGLLLTLAEVHGLGPRSRPGPGADGRPLLGPRRQEPRIRQSFLCRTGRMPNMIQAGTYSATLQISEGGQGRQFQGH